MSKLWYNTPADDWNEALPIGNGRIGAMVFGDAMLDRLQINEETLWSGSPDLEKRSHTMDEMLAIRELVNKGEYDKADELAAKTMLNADTQHYVSFGNILGEIRVGNGRLAFENKGGFDGFNKDYIRELDMDEGIVSSYARKSGTRDGSPVPFARLPPRRDC